jgi:hypothetical protein
MKSIYTLLFLLLLSSHYLFGQSTHVLSLNGTTDFVQVPRLSENATNTVTIEGWINPDGKQTSWSGIYVFRSTTLTTYGIMLRENNELGYMWEDSNGARWSWSSGLTVPANEWSHIALVISPTNATLYLNGTASVHNKTCNPIVLNAANIGYDSENSTRKFKGSIHNMRIWNIARSASELTANSTTLIVPETTGLLAEYRFSSQTANDFSGNSKNATLNGCGFKATEIMFETAILFNGTTDYGVLPRVFSSDPSVFSIQWWLNPATTTKRHSLSGGGTGWGWGAFWFVVNANGSAQVGTNLDGSYLGNLIPAGTIEFNKWQHLTFTLSGGVGKFYKNGVLIALKSGITNPQNFTKLDLGSISSGADYYIKGMLDDIKIWSTERSREEIEQDMYSRQAPHSDLKGYWNFNSKVPGALTDSSGNGMNGTMNGGAYTGYVRPKFRISCDSVVQTSAPITQISAGAKDQLLQSIKIHITNSGSSLKAQSLHIDLEGTTRLADIEKLSLYYANGITDGLNTTHRIAGITPNSHKISIALNDLTITQNTTFWLTADISTNATAGNNIKSVCTKVEFVGRTAIPTDTTAGATHALSILPVVAFSPTEKTSGTIHNPGLGLSVYIDGYSGIFSNKRPKYDNGLRYPELFWHYLDSIGASEKLNVLYIRLPWSEMEPTEGEYIWNHDPKYLALIQGALDRNLRLAFRVYFDSGDSYQQATPDWVRTAGAKGYTSGTNAWSPEGNAITCWNPYNNDVVFLQKVRNFINAFGAKYNNPTIVDYIDANGMGLWGEGNNPAFDNSQPNNNRNWVFTTIATYYRAAFPDVLLGVQNASENDAVTVNITRQITDIYRRDSFGATQWLPESDKAFYASEVKNGIPLFAENAWNAFNPIVKPTYYRDWGFDSPEGMIRADYRDVKAARANSADLRIPSDAVLWMKTNLVDSLVNNLGYRLVPSNLYSYSSAPDKDSLTFCSSWTNSGWGCFPNRRPAWNHKYKLAYALLDSNQQPVRIFVAEAEPADWFKGNIRQYQTKVSVHDIPNGTYTLAYAIVNSRQNNQPAIELAITDSKTNTHWYTFGTINLQRNTNHVEKLSDPKAKVSIISNPVKSILSIKSDSEILSVRIYDINGRLVYQCNNPHNDRQINITVNQLSPGTYIAKTENKHGENALRFIKE